MVFGRSPGNGNSQVQPENIKIDSLFQEGKLVTFIKTLIILII